MGEMWNKHLELSLARLRELTRFSQSALLHPDIGQESDYAEAVANNERRTDRLRAFPSVSMTLPGSIV